jgi:hypothetical protein
VLRGDFGPLSINVLGLDFQLAVINWTWIRSPFSQYDRPAPPEDHAECARQRRSGGKRRGDSSQTPGTGAVEGKANAALVAFLAETLRVPKAAVSLKSKAAGEAG